MVEDTRDSSQIKNEVDWAKDFAEHFKYDQIVVIGRRVGMSSDNGEFVTTFGRNKLHSTVAEAIGKFIKHRVMGWKQKTG